MDLEILRVLRRSFGKKCLRQVWARGFWVEDKEGKWGVWSWSLEGDLEGVCLVLRKYGVQGFPDLFSMAAQRNVTVEEYWDQNLGQGRLGVLEGRRGWLFKVKKAYSVLANSEGADFPHSNVWVDKVQPKLLFLLGKLLGEGPHFG
ncbi:hypothetical protein CK203_067402 [Vitis vinifera]|uniref:Uncharacterized protein n=1 Tax=Vitis vinifera TaxID=29760 RepID=A0A438EFJ5_VITVI|nr:hypothetical protein CK203_067402 [Vitis vinifera]